ncbi:MAG: hypothetical protein ACE5FC_04815 [Myxococcota bacterium]
MRNLKRSILSGALLLGLVAANGVHAEGKVSWDGSKPAPGVYFYWYEPSFYTGFAPRSQDRDRIHLELGRGNQQRLTIVLGPEQLDAYPGNLLARRDAVQELLAKGVIALTVNNEFDRFVQGLKDAGVEEAVAARASLGPEAYRARAVKIMEKLNPDRVFRIRIPVDRLVADWHAALSGMGAGGNALDAANAVLPGRANLYELSAAVKAELDKAVAMVAAGQGAGDPAFRAQTLEFLELATQGHYPVVDGEVRAIEFTAIYPAGTAQAWTTYKGRKLPDFGVSGVWTLTPRMHGKGIMGMVDYLSTNPGYGFIPLLGYQYAGGIAYNALHNAGVRSQLNSTRFLPSEWRKVAGERNPKKNYQNLWIGSRGPASHGCTRLPSGHMSELRDALPSTSKDMEGVPNFRNKAQCYDVFDIDGDGKAEVMGVQYYLAYWGHKHLPVDAYAPNDRKGFYEWLYGDNLTYGPVGSATIKEVPVCRFTGLRKAEEARTLHDVPLYEAPYARESIQFYKNKRVNFQTRPGMEFNREMRRIGAGYELNRQKLYLD